MKALPIRKVVFDHGAFNVRHIQEHQYGNRLIACDLANPTSLPSPQLRRQRLPRHDP